MRKISEMTISSKKMIAMLSNLVREVGGPEAASELWTDENWTISASFIRQVMTGAVRPGKNLCELLGYEPVKEIKYRYRRVS